MHYSGVGKFEFKNCEELQHDTGCLIIANHPTLIDYVAIVSKLKYCNTIVKEKLWKNPFLRRVIQSAGYIPNLQSSITFERVQETLRQGKNVLIFPEGTRTTPGEPITFKRGAAQIAVRTGAPIRIIHITCQPTTLTKNEKWYHIPPKRSHFIVEVGEKIDSSSFLQDTTPPSIAARRLTSYLKNILGPVDVLICKVEKSVIEKKNVIV